MAATFLKTRIEHITRNILYGSDLSLAIIVVELILIPVAFIVSNPLVLIGFMRGSSLPMPRSQDIEAVSGLYGPGTYIAWVLCTISAIIGSATKDPPSRGLSPDQIASFIYSISTMYWYYGRIVWYRPWGLDLIQDHSVQAASFVLNVSTLFHGLGFILSSERKKKPWLFFVVWDAWLACISPMILVDIPSLLLVVTVFPMLQSLVPTFMILFRLSPWKLVLLSLLPFTLLEAVRCQFSTTSLLIMPKTASSLTDLDQFVSLITALILVVYQWRLWNLADIAHKLRRRFGRNPTRSNSIQLEASSSQSYDYSGSPEYTETH
jgi:hypothetical protein